MENMESIDELLQRVRTSAIESLGEVYTPEIIEQRIATIKADAEKSPAAPHKTGG